MGFFMGTLRLLQLHGFYIMGILIGKSWYVKKMCGIFYSFCMYMYVKNQFVQGSNGVQ